MRHELAIVVPGFIGTSEQGFGDDGPGIRMTKNRPVLATAGRISAVGILHFGEGLETWREFFDSAVVGIKQLGNGVHGALVLLWRAEIGED